MQDKFEQVSSSCILSICDEISFQKKTIIWKLMSLWNISSLAKLSPSVNKTRSTLIFGAQNGKVSLKKNKIFQEKCMTYTQTGACIAFLVRPHTNISSRIGRQMAFASISNRTELTPVCADCARTVRNGRKEGTRSISKTLHSL